MCLLPALILLSLPGCRAAQDPITGPGAVSGPEGGSLSLLCNYTSHWKSYKKVWCRGPTWVECTNLVSTTGSEQEVKKDRISIRDDQKNLRFTVTMKELRRDDAGIYWCAIMRTGYDHKSQVTVIVDPATNNSAAARTATGTSLGPILSTTEKITSNQPGTHTPNPLSCFSSVHFLLLVFLELPLLLSMVGAVLWVNRPLSGPGKRQDRPEE